VAPVLGKTFSPATVNAGTVSTLTITLSNPNAAIATLTAPLVDTLPGGLVIAPTPNAGTTCTGAGAPVAVAGSGTLSLPAGRSIPSSGSCTLTVSVTAAAGGTYINTLLAGSLATSNGGNPAAAVATLTVVTPLVAPVLGKAFSPATVNAGAVSTLTITLSNPNAAIATLNAALVDTLPVGMVIASTPQAATTCSGAGAPVAIAGSGTVSLPAGRSIPSNGSCTLAVNVTAAAGGTYINTLLAGALATSNGNNANPAIATLTGAALVTCPIVTMSPGTLPSGVVDTPYAQSILVSPADTYSLSVPPGSLPRGLSLDALKGAISGTPAAVGTFAFTIAATSTGGCLGTRDYSVTIVPSAVPVAAREIPTLSEWAMIALAALIGAAGVAAAGRRHR
jgi:uncharacterized repeat protein (TIGR01451 family)